MIFFKKVSRSCDFWYIFKDKDYVDKNYCKKSYADINDVPKKLDSFNNKVLNGIVLRYRLWNRNQTTPKRPCH